MEADLDDLDDFLREIWFEHYEHFSGFRIDDTHYSLAEDERGDLSFLDTLGASEEEEEEEEEEEIVDNYVDGEKLVAEILQFYPDLLPSDLLPSDVIETLKQEWFLYDLLPFLKEKQKTAHNLMMKLFNEKERDLDAARLAYRQSDVYKFMITLVEDRSTYVQLQYVLKAGKKFYYTYDYGTSTDLTLRVVSEREGIIRDEEDPIELLALNVAPEILCVVCGKPATQIVVGYYDVLEHAYCDECAKNLADKKDEDEEDEDEEEEYIYIEEPSFIEIENTPRVGIIS